MRNISDQDREMLGKIIESLKFFVGQLERLPKTGIIYVRASYEEINCQLYGVRSLNGFDPPKPFFPPHENRVPDLCIERYYERKSDKQTLFFYFFAEMYTQIFKLAEQNSDPAVNHFVNELRNFAENFLKVDSTKGEARQISSAKTFLERLIPHFNLVLAALKNHSASLTLPTIASSVRFTNPVVSSNNDRQQQQLQEARDKADATAREIKKIKQDIEIELSEHKQIKQEPKVIEKELSKMNDHFSGYFLAARQYFAWMKVGIQVLENVVTLPIFLKSYDSYLIDILATLGPSFNCYYKNIGEFKRVAYCDPLFFWRLEPSISQLESDFGFLSSNKCLTTIFRVDPSQESGFMSGLIQAVEWMSRDSNFTDDDLVRRKIIEFKQALIQLRDNCLLDSDFKRLSNSSRMDVPLCNVKIDEFKAFVLNTMIPKMTTACSLYERTFGSVSNPIATFEQVVNRALPPADQLSCEEKITKQLKLVEQVFQAIGANLNAFMSALDKLQKRSLNCRKKELLGEYATFRSKNTKDETSCFNGNPVFSLYNLRGHLSKSFNISYFTTEGKSIGKNGWLNFLSRSSINENREEDSIVELNSMFSLHGEESCLTQAIHLLREACNSKEFEKNSEIRVFLEQLEEIQKAFPKDAEFMAMQQHLDITDNLNLSYLKSFGERIQEVVQTAEKVLENIHFAKILSAGQSAPSAGSTSLLTVFYPSFSCSEPQAVVGKKESSSSANSGFFPTETLGQDPVPVPSEKSDEDPVPSAPPASSIEPVFSQQRYPGFGYSASSAIVDRNEELPPAYTEDLPPGHTSTGMGPRRI